MEKPNILLKCKGRTLNLKHPIIKKYEEYRIYAYKECEGKHGKYFILYCYLPKLKKYQRVYSNTKLTKFIDGHPICSNYDMWEDSMIYVWQKESGETCLKFYPGNINEYNGVEYRTIDFDMNEDTDDEEESEEESE